MTEKAIFFALNADEMLRKGKNRKAAKLCRKGLKKFPEYQTAYVILANAELLRKRKSRAIKYLKKGLQIFPESKALKNQFEIARNSKSSFYVSYLKPALISFSGILVALLAGIFIVPTVFPDFSSGFAEQLRSYVSPQFVAKLEEVSFEAQDYYNNMKYNLGDKQQIEFSDASIKKKIVVAKQDDSSKHQNPSTLNQSKLDSSNAQNSQTKKDSSENKINIQKIGFSSNEWNEYLTFNDETLLYNRKTNPDQSKPYCQVFFVKIRLDKINLHLAQKGKIPESQQNDRLIAAFNGGFRHVHGGYGIKINGEEIYEPKNNIGTLVIYKSGKIDVVRWDSQFKTDSNIISFRQNCPLIVEKGEVTHDISKSPTVWGFTVDNKTVTWRSGIGITPDKKYLIYGFGKSLTVSTLASAFKQIGVENAMQLDINWGWTKFVLYSKEDDIHARGIIGSTSVRKFEYLKPRENSSVGRDFFYLTYKK